MRGIRLAILQRDSPRIRAQEAGDRAQQRGLAGAVGSSDQQRLPCANARRTDRQKVFVRRELRTTCRRSTAWDYRTPDSHIRTVIYGLDSRRGQRARRARLSRRLRHERCTSPPRQLQVPQDAHRWRQDLPVFLAARCREERAHRHLQPAALAEGAAGEPAALRGRPLGQSRRHPRRRRMAQDQDLHPRDRLPSRPRADAGLHRRSGRGGPGRHARRHAAPGRRPFQDQPAGAGRPRHRSLRPGRLLRLGRRLRQERRARIRAQQGALRVPALGRRRLQQLPRGAARHRHLPPGQPRVPGADGLDQGHRRGAPRPSPTPASAPTATPPWSMRWACSAGAWAASRPRLPCSASRSPW